MSFRIPTFLTAGLLGLGLSVGAGEHDRASAYGPYIDSPHMNLYPIDLRDTIDATTDFSNYATVLDQIGPVWGAPADEVVSRLV
ncbi:MAG TPA: hypothetical protein DDY14_13180 [Chromatiaceae bacterium]|jgi:hypothetical protein|nr:MAG: hypothetical protein N838_20590 [Thiohalocapsa sp. PB-PSB1]QQO56723.1 MAG: hypothetical protein N838_28530 [Thiohalocapsa sp. PB-PSB1]HBG96233.1 hypothetical protein [Chromatiaceae bacterium]HCS89758.1 hypothetical protein [Chromatiaceae bacterium]